MGGAVAYVSLISRYLESSVAVISKIGSDFPQSYLTQLSKAGVDVSNILKFKNEQSTSFTLTYNTDLSYRKLKLRKKGSPITVNDLPNSINAKILHVAPIDGEISYEVVRHLRGFCKYLSIDPQGITRQFDEKGKVTANSEIDKQILQMADIYKSSSEEILVITGCSDLEYAIKDIHAMGPKIVIVTMGDQGSIISAHKIIHKIPAYKSHQTIDPTGAGDVFIGAFLHEFLHNEQDLVWCAYVGSAASSIAIEKIGTNLLTTKDEIYKRARSLCET